MMLPGPKNAEGSLPDVPELRQILLLFSVGETVESRHTVGLGP
jgi:hypothetical protein